MMDKSKDNIDKVSGGYHGEAKLEVKILKRKIVQYKDPLTHSTAHKYKNIYSYIVTVGGESTTFSSYDEALKFFEGQIK